MLRPRREWCGSASIVPPVSASDGYAWGPLVTRAPGLALTGERTLPDIAHENYWFRRHEAAYRLAASVCRGAVTLDAGCGEGYGAAILPGTVFAVDLDAAVAAHVASTYPEVWALRANLVTLPLGDAVVDAVVSLQVIEHVWDQPGMLAEFARVLRPGGALVLSTPNRLTFAPGNPFHSCELSAAELAGLLGGPFGLDRMLGLRHGPRLVELDRRHDGLVDAQLAGPPSAWDARLRADVASVRAEDFEITPYDVDTALDLIAVARPGVGRAM